MFHHEPGMSVIDCVDEVEVRFSFPGNLRHRKNLRWMGCSPDAIIHSLHPDSTDMTVFFAHSMLLSSSSPCFGYLLAKAFSQVNPVSVSPDGLLRKRFEVLQAANLSSLEIDESINLLTLRLMGRGTLYSPTGRGSPSCLERSVLSFGRVQTLSEPMPKNPVMLTVRAYCAVNGSVVLILGGPDPVFFKYLLHCIYSEHFTMKKCHVELFVALITAIKLINHEKLTDLLIPFIEHSATLNPVNPPVPCYPSHWPLTPSSLPLYMEYGFPEGRLNNGLTVKKGAVVAKETLSEDEPLDLSCHKRDTLASDAFTFPLENVSWQGHHREASTKEFDYLLTSTESRHCYSDAFRKIKSSTFSCGVFKTLMYPPLENRNQTLSPDVPDEGTRLALCPGGYFIEKRKAPPRASQGELNPAVLFPSQRVVDVPDRCHIPRTQLLPKGLKRGGFPPTSDVYSGSQFTSNLEVAKKLCPESEWITPSPSRDGGSSSDPCCSGVSKPRPVKSGSVQRPADMLGDDSCEEDSCHSSEDPMGAAILLKDSLEKLEKNSAIEVRLAKRGSLGPSKKGGSRWRYRSLPSSFAVEDLHPVVSNVVRSNFTLIDREGSSHNALPHTQCTELARLNPQVTKLALHSSQASEPSIFHSHGTQPAFHNSTATEPARLHSKSTEPALPYSHRKKPTIPQSHVTETALHIHGIESVPSLTQGTKAAQTTFPTIPNIEDSTAGAIRGASHPVAMMPFRAELEPETIKTEEYKIEPLDPTEELTVAPPHLSLMDEMTELAIKIEEVHGGLLSPPLPPDPIDGAHSTPVPSLLSASSPLMCLCCGIRFRDPTDIIPHMRQRHFSDIRSAPCADVRCPVQLLFCSREWEVHVLHHVVKYSFRCRICSYSTKTAIGVSRHELAHRMAPRKAFKPVRKNQTRVSRVASRLARSSHKCLKGGTTSVCSPLAIETKKNRSRGHRSPANPVSRLESGDVLGPRNGSKAPREPGNQPDKALPPTKTKDSFVLKSQPASSSKGRGDRANERKGTRSRKKTRTPVVSLGTGHPRLKCPTKKDDAVRSPKSHHPSVCPKVGKASVRSAGPVRKRSKTTTVVASVKVEKPSADDVADAPAPPPAFPLPLPFPEPLPEPPRRRVRTKKVRVARKKPRQRLVSCVFCTTTVSSREGLVSHYFHFHRFALPLPCPYEGCEFILKNSRQLHQHVGSHLSKGTTTRSPEIAATRDGGNEGQLTMPHISPVDQA